MRKRDREIESFQHSQRTYTQYVYMYKYFFFIYISRISGFRINFEKVSGIRSSFILYLFIYYHHYYFIFLFQIKAWKDWNRETFVITKWKVVCFIITLSTFMYIYPRLFLQLFTLIHFFFFFFNEWVSECIE